MVVWRQPGDVIRVQDLIPKLIAYKGVYLYVQGTTLKWTAGSILVAGTEYTISAGSLTSATDKLVLVSCDDSTNTATFELQSPNLTLDDTANTEKKFLVAYIDVDGRITYFNQPESVAQLSGYTITKATGNVSVSGQGFILGAFAYGFAYSRANGSCDAGADTSASITITVDGTTIFSDSDSHNYSNYNCWGIASHSQVVFSGFVRFNSSLSVNISASASGWGDSTWAHYKKVVIYAIK